MLVDDHCRCVISDFGQSEMKSEVCRITGSSMQSKSLSLSIYEFFLLIDLSRNSEVEGS